MNQLNRFGLALTLYIVFLFLLDMQEDISELSHMIFSILGFLGAILIAVPDYSKGEKDDDI